MESFNETETLSRNDVIAMASVDDQQIEIISDTVNSNATNYASMSYFSEVAQNSLTV